MGLPLELGHHWQVAAYVHEIHFQLISIAALALVAAAAFVIRTRGKRGVRQ